MIILFSLFCVTDIIDGTLIQPEDTAAHVSDVWFADSLYVCVCVCVWVFMWW